MFSVSREHTHLSKLVELWTRRAEPESRTPRRALRLAERLAGDPEAIPAELALAWTIVTDVYTTLDWEVPVSPELARCRSAAVSVAQSAGMVVDEVLRNLEDVEGNVLVLGELGFALAVFGRPDVFPARGAILVPLDAGDDGPVSASGIPASKGVRWAHGGRLREVFAETAVPGVLGGREVLLPDAGLAAALTASAAATGDRLSGILFCFAAHLTTTAGHWEAAGATARNLGTVDRIAAAAWRWGLQPDPSLGNPLLLRLRTMAQKLAPVGRRG